VYFVVANVTTLMVAIIASVRTPLGGALWQPDFWLQLQLLWLYAIITSAVWYLPISGWLLLASAWAKRAVILWALLPPLAIMLAERLFTGTNVAAHVLGLRLFGYPQLAFHEASTHEWSMQAGDPAAALGSAWRLLDLGRFFANQETWIGVIVGAALIALAVQLRARRLEG
jgi:ABC-2 type transport system permease protein